MAVNRDSALNCYIALCENRRANIVDLAGGRCEYTNGTGIITASCLCI